MEKMENNRSRRGFLKSAAGVSVGLVGLQTVAFGATDLQPQDNKKDLFSGKPTNLKDSIERVKIATLGMQRYDWEQGTVAQAFLEIGETDLAISFARGAILRQVKGRFSVIKDNGPINDCSSIGEVVLFASKKTGDPIFKTGADAMLEVLNLQIIKHLKELFITHRNRPNGLCRMQTICYRHFSQRQANSRRRSNKLTDFVNIFTILKISYILTSGTMRTKNSNVKISGA